MKKYIYLLTALLVIPLFSDATRWYVDVNNNNIIRNGNSWNTAVRHIRHLKDDLQDGDEVWIAQGTYEVEQDCNFFGSCVWRTPLESFGKDVDFYGGFEGDETTLSQRNPNLYVSLIELSTVRGLFWTSSNIIDGFEFTGTGSSSGSLFRSSPNEMLTLRNCIFDSVNGDVLFDNGYATGSGEFGEVIIEDSEFNDLLIRTSSNNIANQIFFENCLLDNCSSNDDESTFFYSCHFVNCEIRNCSTPRFSWQSLFEGCLIRDNNMNAASDESAVMGTSEFRSCTVVENTINKPLSGTFANSIIVDQSLNGAQDVFVSGSSLLFCIVDQDTETNNEISVRRVDPLFVDQSNNNYRLSQCSPAINGGFGPGVTDDDLDGNDRFFDGTLDLGCYEYQGDFPERIYVDQDASGNGSGINWTNAVTDLQTALDMACSRTEVWVKEGIYKPGNSRGDRFEVNNGTKLYGGFDGTETSPNQRDYESNISLLSGAIGLPWIQDNSFRIVQFISGDEPIVLDGFAIMNGNANGSNSQNNRGAAIGAEFPNAIVRNCYIGFNNGIRGAGIYSSGSGSLTLENVRLENNTATEKGAAIYTANVVNLTPDLLVNRCIFKTNNAPEGGACNLEAEADFENSLFINNISPLGASIYQQDDSDIEVVHCTLVSQSNAINAPNASTTILNSIFQNNGDDYVGGSGSFSGSYNLTDNTGGLGPLTLANTTAGFVDAGNDNYRLANNSPAVNAGSSTYLNRLTYPESDLDGDTRVIAGTPDIGAYENQDGCANDNDFCSSALDFDLVADYGAVLNLDCSSPDGLSSDCEEVTKSIWVRINVPATGVQFLITPVESSTDLQLTAYSGDCANLELIACANNLVAGQNENLVLDGSFDWVYLEIASINNSGGGVNVFPFILSPNISSDVVVGNASDCYSNTDGELVFDQEITVEYINPPVGGFLVIERPFAQDEFFEITESPQTITVTELPGDLESISLTAKFAYDGTETAFTTWPDVIIPCCAPLNDECEFALTMEIGEVISGSTRCATENDWIPSSCILYGGRDLWYKFNPTCPNLRIDMTITEEISGPVNPRFTIFSGNCGNLTEFACGNDAFEGFDESHTFNGFIPGGNYYLRASVFSDQEAEFELLITPVGDPISCPADFNSDCSISTADLTFLLADMNCSQNCMADLNGDSIVNTADLTSFLAVFGTTCN